MNTADLIAFAVLALVLLGYWRLGHYWSHRPPRPYPKVRRPKEPKRWEIWLIWPWTLPR